MHLLNCKLWPRNGVLRFGLDKGMLLKPQNPCPFWGSFWPKKYLFLWIFWKHRFIFNNFWVLANKHPKIWLSHENWSMFRDSFVEKWDPCFGISCGKSDPLEQWIPVYLNVETPSLPAWGFGSNLKNSRVWLLSPFKLAKAMEVCMSIHTLIFNCEVLGMRSITSSPNFFWFQKKLGFWYH